MGYLVIRNVVEQQDNTPPERLPTLSKEETTSIVSLIVYAAYQHNIEEERVHTATLQKFSAETVSQIKSQYFDEAIRYLVDLQPSHLVN